ncbi:MAG: acetyl-CoA synthase subunit gamma [Candidatus Nealsonbacteria bacterium]|nr:acetyl-CoA synthase subunit gamma [Candidatus Nealsonbacteria bacterium]
MPQIFGTITTPAGEVPRVDTTLQTADRLGAWMARWAMGRMRYAVEPGLYAAGQPTADSPVLVSANYKMSFDQLRCRLAGLDAWILVLDTRGINVWCAAGKGTFGTDEIVHRIAATGLAEVVSHRRVIVPQLGAPGIAAHDVKHRSGFRVIYGPVRAEDLPAFLAAKMKATPEMRRVRFPIRDRVVLVPVELMMTAKYFLVLAACVLFLAGVGPGEYWTRVLGIGIRSAALVLAVSVGTLALVPTLLPWLPGRAFALKGLWIGLAFAAAVLLLGWSHGDLLGNRLSLAAWCLLLPATASFLGMNFTGASTYTSLSGVRKEMALAVPLQALAVVAGMTLWLIAPFV